MEEGMIEGLAHIGIAVTNMDEAIKFFQDKFGAVLDDSRGENGRMNFGLHVSAVVKIGSLAFELMEPTQPGLGPVGSFIVKNGGKGGIHHISLKVDKFQDAKADFEKKEMQVMGELGGVMAFLHPKTCMGILTEFTEVV